MFGCPMNIFTELSESGDKGIAPVQMKEKPSLVFDFSDERHDCFLGNSPEASYQGNFHNKLKSSGLRGQWQILGASAILLTHS